MSVQRPGSSSRFVTFVAACVIGLSGCSGVAPSAAPADHASPTPGSPTGSVTAANAAPSPVTSTSAEFGLVGTWHRDQTCEETAKLFESLGLRELGASYITDNGFRSESVATVAADMDMCRGASGPKARTITFEVDGHWTGTSDGQQVDDGSLSIGEDRSFVLPADPSDGSPALTVIYRVDGDTATFTVQKPQPCTDKACIEQVAWAKETFQLGPWTRR